MNAFIDTWNVDIGDKARKGDVQAGHFVPEIREELASKKATLGVGQERVRLAKKDVK